MCFQQTWSRKNSLQEAFTMLWVESLTADALNIFKHMDCVSKKDKPSHVQEDDFPEADARKVNLESLLIDKGWCHVQL